MVITIKNFIVLTSILSLFTLQIEHAVASEQKGENQNILSISELHNAYSIHKPVTFVIKNNSNTDYYYICAVQVYFENENKWYELFSSINQPKFSKKADINKINSNQLCKLSWKSSEVHTKVHYRFKIYILDKPDYIDQAKSVVFSEYFVFVK